MEIIPINGMFISSVASRTSGISDRGGEMISHANWEHSIVVANSSIISVLSAEQG